MTRELILRLTGKQHRQLHHHLFPGDGLEAVAVLLCGRRAGEVRHCLSTWKVLPIPHAECVRADNRLHWKTDRLVPLLREAAEKDLAVVKVHSHPTGWRAFSQLDDRSDRDLFPSVFGWTESDSPHASVIMLPDGELLGRGVTADGHFFPLTSICVVGDDIRFWFLAQGDTPLAGFTVRNAQAFGRGTTVLLGRLSVGVVGCSGTGSPTIEQLHRLNVREIVGVDPDHVGVENLNRIPHARADDARQRLPKVAVLDRSIREAGLGPRFVPLAEDLRAPGVIERLAECDVLFGCVDSIEGRHLLNKLASTYCIPYFDVGIRLRADGAGGVEQVSGAVHYLQPDGSSFLSRGVYTLEQYRADCLRRSDPAEYERQRTERYIEGGDETRPAVITVNMVFSGLAVFEFLCRVHAVRDEDNAGYASQRISLNQSIAHREGDGERCPVVTRNAGRGDMVPLLGMPELSGKCAPT